MIHAQSNAGGLIRGTLGKGDAECAFIVTFYQDDFTVEMFKAAGIIKIRVSGLDKQVEHDMTFHDEQAIWMVIGFCIAKLGAEFPTA